MEILAISLFSFHWQDGDLLRGDLDQNKFTTPIQPPQARHTCCEMIYQRGENDIGQPKFNKFAEGNSKDSEENASSLQNLCSHGHFSIGIA